MKLSIKTGFSFGLTSGIITTLGLMVGLSSGTHSKLVVLGGVITIAIADAFSDSLSIHVSEEATRQKRKKIWESTISTFISKFFFALLFIIPLLLFSLSAAVLISIILGLTILGIYSFHIAKQRHANPIKAIAEHLIIALIVICATHLTGTFISAALFA